MPDELTKPRWPELTKEQRQERKLARRDKRQAELEGIVSDLIHADARFLRLKRYMFKSDEELSAAYLSKQQIALVRQWELPKKEAPAGLLAAQDTIMAYIRREQRQAGIQVNVQNAIIKLPEKHADDKEPVYIDVEPGK